MDLNSVRKGLSIVSRQYSGRQQALLHTEQNGAQNSAACVLTWISKTAYAFKILVSSATIEIKMISRHIRMTLPTRQAVQSSPLIDLVNDIGKPAFYAVLIQQCCDFTHLSSAIDVDFKVI